MPKLEKADKRDKARNKARKGPTRSGDSVKLLFRLGAQRG